MGAGVAAEEVEARVEKRAGRTRVEGGSRRRGGRMPSGQKEGREQSRRAEEDGAATRVDSADKATVLAQVVVVVEREDSAAGCEWDRGEEEGPSCSARTSEWNAAREARMAERRGGKQREVRSPQPRRATRRQSDCLTFGPAIA